MRVRSEARIGIRDVAAAAGVSPTTVSHALNGKGRLTDETRERVARVAHELGYRPNTSAQNLVSGRTGLLGIAVSADEGSPLGVSDFDYFIQLLSGATAAALECGHVLAVAGPGDNETFARVTLDGAIVVDPIASDPLVASVRSAAMPVVTTGRVPDQEPGAEEHWVDNDHAAGTRAILDHLADQGARRIALVACPPVTSFARDAAEGYESWCRERGLEPLVSVAGGDLAEGAGFVASTALLELADPPDAIYATLDRLALGVLLAARSRGIEVPRDLLVAGCTDSAASARAEPPLTALALDPEEIGRRAVEMLLALVEQDEPVPRNSIVPTQVLARESTRRLEAP